MRNSKAASSANRHMLVFTALVIIAFTGAVVFTFTKNKNTSVESGYIATNSESGSVFNNDYEEDNDGDGLANWEETLWGTDPDNADTDGDGIHDKEDVFAERETGVALGDLSALSQDATGNKENTPNTATGALSKDFFSSYMNSLKNGSTFSEEEQEQALIHSIEKSAELITPPTYTLEDIHTVPATDKSRVVYIQSVLTTFQNMITGTVSEKKSMYKIAQGNTEEGVKDLQETVAKYTEYAESFRTMPVPSDALEIHQNMVSKLLFYIYTLEGLSLINDDPLRAAAAFSIFMSAYNELGASYKPFSTYASGYKENITVNASFLNQ